MDAMNAIELSTLTALIVGVVSGWAIPFARFSWPYDMALVYGLILPTWFLVFTGLYLLSN